MSAIGHLLSAGVLALATATAASAAAPDAALLARLAAAETMRVIVEQAYVARRPDTLDTVPIAGLRLPFENVAAGLVRSAGVRVVGADAATYDATLTITAQGRALGRIYHRGVTGLLYAGAMLSGEIVFTAPGVPAWRTPFSVRRQPPLEVTLNLGYERPANAPFVEVFARSASFVPRLMAVIGAIYGVRPLIATIETEGDEALRRSAAHALGDVGEAGAGEALIAALADADAGLRREAAWALGRLGEGRAVAPLRRALADADPDVRWFAAWALARITGAALDDIMAATTAGDGAVLPISNEQD